VLDHTGGTNLGAVVGLVRLWDAARVKHLLAAWFAHDIGGQCTRPEQSPKVSRGHKERGSTSMYKKVQPCVLVR
jgi:hypothetical protein